METWLLWTGLCVLSCWHTGPAVLWSLDACSPAAAGRPGTASLLQLPGRPHFASILNSFCSQHLVTSKRPRIITATTYHALPPFPEKSSGLHLEKAKGTSTFSSLCLYWTRLLCWASKTLGKKLSENFKSTKRVFAENSLSGTRQSLCQRLLWPSTKKSNNDDAVPLDASLLRAVYEPSTDLCRGSPPTAIGKEIMYIFFIKKIFTKGYSEILSKDPIFAEASTHGPQ